MPNHDKLTHSKRDVAKRALMGEDVDIHTEFSRVESKIKAESKLQDKVKRSIKKDTTYFTPATDDNLRTGGVNPTVYREAPVVNDFSPIYQQQTNTPNIPPVAPDLPELLPKLSRDTAESVQATLDRLEKQQTNTIPVVTARSLPTQQQLDNHQRQHKLIIGIILLIVITLVLIAAQSLISSNGNPKIEIEQPMVTANQTEYQDKALQVYNTPTVITLTDQTIGPIQQLRSLGINLIGISPLSINQPINVMRYQDDFMISFTTTDYPAMARALREWEKGADNLIFKVNINEGEFSDETYLAQDYRVLKNDNQTVLSYTIINKHTVIIGSNPAFIMQNIANNRQDQ